MNFTELIKINGLMDEPALCWNLCVCMECMYMEWIDGWMNK